MAIADMEVETSKVSKLTRFARIVGMVAMLALSAVLVGGCGGGGDGGGGGGDGETCDACCQLRKYQENQGLETDLGLNDIAVGTSEGVACRHRVEAMWDDPIMMFSASKMVTGVLILKLVDRGLLTLDTKAADVLDFWNATDARKNVTLRHLLSQTSGLQRYPGGLGRCTAATTSGCALEAYEVGFADWFTAPGEMFAYNEATFFVVGAMALERTGLQTYDDVFQQYLAQPLGINGSRCGWVDYPNLTLTKEKADPGGTLICHTLEFAKILTALAGRTLFDDSSLHDEAETPHTLSTLRSPDEMSWNQNCVTQEQIDAGCMENMMPRWSGDGVPISGDSGQAYWHYGLGQWIECSTPQCEGGILRASSMGAFGTYPWVDRRGSVPHWGLVVRYGNAGAIGTLASGESRNAVLTTVVPLTAEIVQGGESTATANIKVMQV